jgi:uncharacterized damage-inducible protein DinB
MTKTQALLAELEQEAQTTRRVLERVPDRQLGFRPHEKSMTLGQLALHVATTPGNVAEISRMSPVPVPKFEQASAASAAEALAALEESLAKARRVLGCMDDAALDETWRAVDGDREVFAIPVGAFLRSIMLNHWYHHRGQLSVYLRSLGVPLPSIYGPSADENPFAAREDTALTAELLTS